MKETTQETFHKSVLHGFFLSNGKFVTPAEMKTMESLEIIRTTKSKLEK